MTIVVVGCQQHWSLEVLQLLIMLLNKVNRLSMALNHFTQSPNESYMHFKSASSPLSYPSSIILNLNVKGSRMVMMEWWAEHIFFIP